MIGRMVAVCLSVMVLGMVAFDLGLYAGQSRGADICQRHVVGRLP